MGIGDLVPEAFSKILGLFDRSTKSGEITKSFSLSSYRLGRPQRSGVLSVVPIFGPNHNGKYVYPRSGLKLSKVSGYGNLELLNSSTSGIGIIPLHMGYIQDKAQNHALCRSAFLASGQKLMFEDACCVQAAQGGYLEGKEQWFFILPLDLREEALNLRGQKNYSKLWDAISHLNTRMVLPSRGHLEQILSNHRSYLTQFQSRLELMPEQTGALFFIKEKLVGLELAPSPGYFQEVWMPLVCFCYGTTAMYEEKRLDQKIEPVPFQANNLTELRAELQNSREQLQKQLLTSLSKLPEESFNINEEERFLSLNLKTAEGKNFVGQFVEDEGQLVYTSIFARKNYLYNGS
jgi:hypothetical protein